MPSWLSSFVIIFEKNCGCLPSPCCRSRHLLTLPSCSSLRWGMNLSAVGHMFKLYVRILGINKWKSWHMMNLMGSDSSVFVDKFLLSVHIFVCLGSWWMSWAFGVSNAGHMAFEFVKSLKNLCSTHFLPSKPACNILKVSVAYFFALKGNLMQTLCSFKSFVFRYSKIVTGKTRICT